MSNESFSSNTSPEPDDIPNYSDELTACEELSSVESVFTHYVDRLLAGDAIDLEEVHRRHPEVNDEVLEQLRSFCDLADDSHEGARPHRIGDFEIIREVGRGGMGVVYEAVQISLGRRVALKVIPAGLAADAKAVARFIREAQVSAQLDHPNVVTVFEMGVDQHVPYYAMEFVEGQTLSDRLSMQREQAAGGSNSELHGRRHYIDLANCFAGAAEGLAHAHRRGVIHRDVKPSNLIFDVTKQSAGSSEQLLRMLDFGLARFDGQESLTASGDMVGSVRYMSPEQASVVQSRRIDHRTDVYSLGATFYEALTLHPPFKGRDVQDTISQIQTSEPKPPTRLNPRIPRDIETIVMKCLRKDPNDRYGSADALAQDLGRFLRGDIIEARPRSSFERCSRWLQRHKVQLAVAACFVALITTAILSWWGSHLAAVTARNLESRQKVSQAAEMLRTAPISLIEATPHDLYLLPAGRYRFFMRKEWAPKPTDAGRASVLDAVDELNSAISLCPELADAYLHRARAYLVNGQSREALADLNELLQLDSGHVPAWLLKSSVHAHLGQSEESQSARSKGEHHADGTLYCRWLEAHDFARQRDYANAAARFRLALDEAKSRPEPYIGWTRETELALAICLKRTGDFLGSLLHLRGDTDDVRVQKAVAYVGLANESRDGKRYEQEADAIFQALGRTAKADVAALVVLEYRRLFIKGSISKLDWTFVDQWLQRIPSAPVRLRIRALCCFCTPGGFKDGATVMREAIRLAPEDASLYYFLAEDGYGLHLVEPGASQELLRLMKKAVELEPSNLEYRANLAGWAVRFKDPVATHHLRVIEASHGTAQLDYWSCINLALAYGPLGDLERAEELFKQAAGLKRSHWTEHNRGLLYRMMADSARDEQDHEMERRHLRTAEAAYTAALRENPRIPMNYRAKAKILKRLGRTEEAVECLEEGWSQAYRPDEEIARRLGDWHQEDGNLEQASVWLLKSVRMNPRPKFIHNNLRSLVAQLSADHRTATCNELIAFFQDLLESTEPPHKEVRVRVMTTLALALEAIGRTSDAQGYWLEVTEEIKTHQYENIESEAKAAYEALERTAF